VASGPDREGLAEILREIKLTFEKDKLLLLLLLTDFVFLILHILYIYTGLLPNNYFSLARDQGYAEFFQYMKEFWLVVLFLILGIRQRKFIFFVFSFLFLYLLVDDSFAIHETYGQTLAEYFGFTPLFGLRPVDFGELVVYAYFIAFSVLWLGVAYILSDPETRRVSRSVIYLLVAFAFFGVLADMLEITVEHPGLSEILKIIEELGEMVVMSIITWFVYRLNLSASAILPDHKNNVLAGNPASPD
jgi:hypothetical protein